jgi:hypothetical protein
VNSLNYCKIYEQVLIFFLLLPPLCFSAAPPAAHRRRFPRLPAAPSPLFLRHLAPSSPARHSPNPAGSSSRGHVAPLHARAATRAVDHQQLLAARPRTSFWLRNTPSKLLPPIPSRAPAFLFFFLLRSTILLELLCSPPLAASPDPPLQFRAPPAPPHLTAPSRPALLPPPVHAQPRMPRQRFHSPPPSCF